jgi:hypothetical protein
MSHARTMQTRTIKKNFIGFSLSFAAILRFASLHGRSREHPVRIKSLLRGEVL